MKVKICGVTCVEDGLAAAQAGADLLGFNFYPGSPRFVNIESCASMVTTIRQEYQKIVLVGIFVNAPRSHVLRILEKCRLDLAQLSGDEPADEVQQLQSSAYKALRPGKQGFLEGEITTYLAAGEPALLLDAHQPGSYGGTGKTGDWQAAARIARKHPILLAGGLNCDNLRQAIQTVHPWGVDVASGVESSPGRKDLEKVREFIRIAKLEEKERQAC